MAELSHVGKKSDIYACKYNEDHWELITTACNTSRYLRGSLIGHEYLWLWFVVLVRLNNLFTHPCLGQLLLLLHLLRLHCSS